MCDFLILEFRVIRLFETGLIPFWVDQQVSNKADQCLIKNRSKIFLSKVPIKLAHLNSAFIVFGFGIGLALLIFLVEIIVSNFICHKRLIKKQETKENIAPHLLSAPARLQLAAIEVW